MNEIIDEKGIAHGYTDVDDEAHGYELFDGLDENEPLLKLILPANREDWNRDQQMRAVGLILESRLSCWMSTSAESALWKLNRELAKTTPVDRFADAASNELRWEYYRLFKIARLFLDMKALYGMIKDGCPYVG